MNQWINSSAGSTSGMVMITMESRSKCGNYDNCKGRWYQNYPPTKTHIILHPIYETIAYFLIPMFSGPTVLEVLIEHYSKMLSGQLLISHP